MTHQKQCLQAPPRPTRFARGFKLRTPTRSPYFFPPSQEACLQAKFRVLWITRYAVVNDENVDSPSLVISEIPICHADYYCCFRKNYFCVITTCSILELHKLTKITFFYVLSFCVKSSPL